MNSIPSISAIRTAVTDLVDRATGEIRGIVDYDNISTYFPEYTIASTFLPRVERSIPSRLIYSSVQGPILKSLDGLYQRQSKFLPGITCDLTLTDKEALVIDYMDLTARLIIQPAQVRMLANLFETLWSLIDE